jgi:hypothetical protein
MDAAAAFEEFQRLKETLPFEPFEVETVDGKRFAITRRFGFAVSAKSVILGDESDRPWLYKHAEIKLIRRPANGATAS